MKRLNQYLLTHYPLLWNTRVVWVLAAALLLHLFFFLGGLASVQTKTLTAHSSPGGVGGESLYTFSILCSLVVLIVWCVFYLRNNAFKSFYRISKNYLAKEFGLVFLVILVSISFMQSFEWGVKLRVRSITNEAQMVQEINSVNRAMPYVPTEKTPYFILNNCEERRRRRSSDDRLLIDPGEGNNYFGKDSTLVREALRRPDAYSFANYCQLFVGSADYSVVSGESISAENKQLLSRRQQTAIKQRLETLFSVLQKYDFDYRLSADELATTVFSDSLFTVKTTIPAQKYNYQYGTVENKNYLNSYELSRLYGFIESCQPGADNWRGIRNTWTVIGYFALSFSVLLLCYRRFSRKVFLISFIGTIVWAIIIGLFGMSGGTSGVTGMLLLLCGIFLFVALFLLVQKTNKTFSGVLLNWHIYLAPFVVLLLITLVEHYYNQQQTYLITDEEMWRRHPFSSWVKDNAGSIAFVNVFAAAAYVAFLFNRWTKKWQLMPEE